MTAKTLPDVAQMGGAPTMLDSGVVPIGDLVGKTDMDDIYLLSPRELLILG